MIRNRRETQKKFAGGARKVGMLRPSQSKTRMKNRRATSRFRDFVGRRDLIRDFCRRLNSSTPDGKILFYRGDMGTGKSSLLRFLKGECCKRLAPTDWEYLNGLDDEQFLLNIRGADAMFNVPCLWLDLSPALPFHGSSSDAVSVLSKLRHSVGRTPIGFPLFDFALASYLNTVTRSAPSGGPISAGSGGLIAALIDVMSKGSGGTLAHECIKVIRRVYRGSALDRFGSAIDPNRLDELAQLEPETELVARLPDLLAEDLNAFTSGEGRCVLMVDSHDTLFGSSSAQPDELATQVDEWLRRLLLGLNREKGIVAVVAGTGRPRWPDAWEASIPADRIDVIEVPAYSFAEAHEVLRSHNVPQQQHSSIIQAARVDDGSVHPLLLSLLVTTSKGRDEGVGVDAASRASPMSAIVGAFLRSLDRQFGDTVKALAAARSFDKELFDALTDRLNIPRWPSTFSHLIQTAIVRKNGASYQIHELLRRALDELADSVTRASHAELEIHYASASSSMETFVERIYHLSKRNGNEAGQLWMRTLEQGLALGQLSGCRTLFTILPELAFVYRPTRAISFEIQAEYYALIGRPTVALHCLYAALATCDEGINVAAERQYLLSCRGRVLCDIAELGSLDPTVAEDYLRQAIAAHEEVAATTQNDPGDLSNLATTLAKLGMLIFERHGAFNEIAPLYHEAIERYNQSLAISPGDVQHLMNRANARAALARLYRRDGEGTNAMLEYSAAVEEYSRCLTVPDAPGVPYPKAAAGAISALTEKATLLASLGNEAGARAHYDRALHLADGVLQFAPDSPHVLLNKAVTLDSSGTLAMQQGLWTDAVSAWDQALACCDKASDVVSHRREFRELPAAILAKLATALGQLGLWDRCLETIGRASAELVKVDSCDRAASIRNLLGQLRPLAISSALIAHAGIRSGGLLERTDDVAFGRVIDLVVTVGNTDDDFLCGQLIDGLLKAHQRLNQVQKWKEADIVLESGRTLSVNRISAHTGAKFAQLLFDGIEAARSRRLVQLSRCRLADLRQVAANTEDTDVPAEELARAYYNEMAMPSDGMIRNTWHQTLPLIRSLRSGHPGSVTIRGALAAALLFARQFSGLAGEDPRPYADEIRKLASEFPNEREIEVVETLLRLSADLAMPRSKET